MNFGIENRNINFASPLIERNVATHSLAHCSLITSIRGPTQVQPAYHTQSSRAKLTCSSTAAWLSPMLLPNTPFRSTAPAWSVSYPPVASAKRNVPVASRLPSSERTKLSALPTPWGALPASSLQSCSLQAYLAKTSARRQVHIGDHASSWNRCGGSSLLWRMRPGASKDAQLAI